MLKHVTNFAEWFIAFKYHVPINNTYTTAVIIKSKIIETAGMPRFTKTFHVSPTLWRRATRARVSSRSSVSALVAGE